MVSNARLDLPDPESPVTTMSLSRGISTVMFLRLCTRAPCTAMVVRAATRAVLEVIRRFPHLLHIDEGQFLYQNVAPLGKVDGRRNLADESLVGQILACGGYALDIEIALEVSLDLGAGPRLAHFAKMI